jgi:hypothetical protein
LLYNYQLQVTAADSTSSLQVCWRSTLVTDEDDGYRFDETWRDLSEPAAAVLNVVDWYAAWRG